MNRVFPVGNKGFTLLEIMIAMMVFLFGVLAIGNLLIKSMHVNTQARLMTNSSIAARSQLEQLLALNYNSAKLQDVDGDAEGGLDDVGFDNDPATGVDADYGPIPDSGDIKVYWNVAVDLPINNVKTVRILVRWRDRDSWKQTAYDGVISTAL